MAITVQKIEAVEVEIERFREKVARLRELRLQESKGISREGKKGTLRPEYLDEDGLPYLSDFPAQTGAIRRASMDLTRALARLRSSKD